ncbi:MAG: nucleotidyl transferase AbiEii/AbiGii toxin family protein [Kiritimatiellae bacterium]|nr:nucleotidyl transferase AbiEii/AbiGii toxin family protein [Kiritimatiellia bacterium]
MLHTETVEPSTLDLLKRLQRLPDLTNTRLVGGTALALHLGHRKSVDLDMFGTFDAIVSYRKLLADAGHSVEGAENGTVQSLRVDNVKVDLVNYPYPWLDDAIEECDIRLAGLKDIAAMKLSAVANRGRKKDFIDVARLFDVFSLEQMLSFYKEKFSVSELSFPLRGLMYFDDAEEDPMPEMFDGNLTWENVKKTVVAATRKYVLP